MKNLCGKSCSVEHFSFNQVFPAPVLFLQRMFCQSFNKHTSLNRKRDTLLNLIYRRKFVKESLLACWYQLVLSSSTLLTLFFSAIIGGCDLLNPSPFERLKPRHRLQCLIPYFKWVGNILNKISFFLEPSVTRRQECINFSLPKALCQVIDSFG